MSKVWSVVIYAALMWVSMELLQVINLLTLPEPWNLILPKIAGGISGIARAIVLVWRPTDPPLQ